MYPRHLGKLVLAAAFTFTTMTPMLSPAQNGAKQDMKNAGSETKYAAQDAGHGVKTGTKKAYHKTKHGTKVAAHKTADTSKTAYHKTVNGTENVGDKIAGKPAKH